MSTSRIPRSGRSNLARTARFALPLLVLAATARAASSPPGLDDMLAAERAFARMAVEQGIKPAFLRYNAPDGILFRPGPVNGIRLWQSRPATEAVLDWAPSFAEIAGSGDFGFTSGPWTFTPAGKKSPEGFGHFVTVWKRNAEGEWRYVVDIGISHDDPKRPLAKTEVTRGPVHPRPDSLAWRKWDAGVGVRRGNVGVGVGTGGAGIGVFSGGGLGIGLGTGAVRTRRDYEWRRTANERNRLMTEERRLAFEAKKHGWERAYGAVAAGDVRVYREGRAPELGVDAAVDASAKLPTTREYVSKGNGVAPSWDLGYAYGIAVARTKGAPPDSASYVHLYRKDESGEWKLMLDIENPFPKRGR